MIKFWVSRKDGVCTEAEGEPISIPELPEYQFVVHQWDWNEYRVSEVTSGLFASTASSRRDAIRRANDKMAAASPELIAGLRAQIKTQSQKQTEWLFQKALRDAEELCQMK
jgi:hypothetical protein